MSETARRRVLVTGASRGIGAAIARSFASAADRVAVHYGYRRQQADGSSTSPHAGHSAASHARPLMQPARPGCSPSAKSLARALGPRWIAVTAVAPGFTQTEMAADELAGERGRQRRAESPLGRIATPEEVAEAVLYLASPQAELASGVVLDLNGASHLRL